MTEIRFVCRDQVSALLLGNHQHGRSVQDGNHSELRLIRKEKMKKVFLLFGLSILLSAAIIALAVTGETVRDPVCGMEIDPATSSFTCEGENGALYFCSDQCNKAFCADPTAYVGQSELDRLGIDCNSKSSDCKENEAKKAKGEKAEASKGCDGCEKAAEVKKAEGCDGQCGQTRIPAINEFHELMMPLEAAVLAGELQSLKKACTELLSRKETVMSASCPDGVCEHGFEKARADFAQKVDALAAACESADDEAIEKAFDEMHDAYGTLDQMAR